MSRRKKFLTVLAFCLFAGMAAVAQSTGIEWPGGKKAAICLTYDDGTLSQLEKAIPDLNRAGLKGTFYLTGKNMVPEFVDRWRMVAAQGHELGCHTLFHPCSGSFDWVPDEYKTESYTLRRIMDELRLMNQFLYAVDGKNERSYAYTCYETEVGGVSFVDTLSKSGLFTGARGGSSPDPPGSGKLNLFDISSMSISDEVPFQEVISYVESAIESGTLAVFCFHGVGGDYITTSLAYHQRIIAYLLEREDALWITTFVEMTEHLSSFAVEITTDNSPF